MEETGDVIIIKEMKSEECSVKCGKYRRFGHLV